MHTLVYSLISKFLHAYMLPVYSVVGSARGGSAGGCAHMRPQAQIQRAIHYCLAMQEVPTQGHAPQASPRTWVAEDTEVNPYAVELVAQASRSSFAHTPKRESMTALYIACSTRDEKRSFDCLVSYVQGHMRREETA